MSEAGAHSRILLATDGSQWAEDAEAYAYCLAASWRATLTAITVLEFPPGLNADYPVNRLYLEELMKQATAHLAELKKRAANRGLSLHTRLSTGIPSEQLLAAALAEDSDLIVVGTKGKTGLEHVLLGSTAERIIRTAPCPVLAVHSHRREQTRGRIDPCEGVSLGRILVPVDFSDCSLDALEYGAWFARRGGASIRLLHVLEPVCYGLDFTLSHATKSDRLRDQMNKRLSDLASAISDSGVAADAQLRGGLPTDSILDTARTMPADLIVMGTHGRRGLSHTLSGSVAEAVLRKAVCPVLTVRSPKFGPSHRRIVSTETSHATAT